MTVRWSEQASSQVEEATAYIAHDRPAAALSWGEGLVAAMFRTARFPFSGRPIPSLDPERFREVLYEGVRVIYRVDAAEVVVLIVWHQRRDPRKLRRLLRPYRSAPGLDLPSGSACGACPIPTREGWMNAGEIVRDGKTGKAVVAGTDVSVGEILAGLAELGSVDALLDARPALVREDVDAALRFAAGAVDRDLGYAAPSRGAGTRQVHEPAAAYGTARMVVVDAEEYESLLDSIEMLKGINAAERDLGAGLGIPHEQVMTELLEKYQGR